MTRRQRVSRAWTLRLVPVELRPWVRRRWFLAALGRAVRG